MTMNIKAVTTCFGYEQITVNTSKGLTVPTRAPDGPRMKVMAGWPTALDYAQTPLKGRSGSAPRPAL